MQFMVRRVSRLVVALVAAMSLMASEQRGVVTFGGLPVPGAVVTASQGDKKFTAITDPQGAYVFPDLPDGTWTIQVQMLGFEAAKNEVAVAPGAGASTWELKMLPLDQIHAEVQLTPAPKPPEPSEATAEKANDQKKDQKKPDAASSASAEQEREELNQRASDGLLINGSQNNAASSPFALFPAFGNNRNGSRSLYNGGFGIFDDNSIWDARPFSLTGQDTLKPASNHFTASAFFGGPLRIPHLLRNGPNFFVGYQWTRNRTDTLGTAIMPTAEQREGQVAPGIVIPKSQISPQAQALLALYPLPNFASNGGYNYQVPLIGVTHQDNLQSRLNQTIDRKNSVFGNFAFQDTRQATPNVFGFLDTTDSLGINTSAHWFHRFGQGIFGNFGYQFSRFSMDLRPYFQNREDISGAAGINGNDRSPLDWGPPAMNFANGIQGLSDAEQSITHNETNALSAAFYWNRSRHNFQFGGDLKRQQFNLLGQANGRGSFTFTGATSGSAFGDFLLGVPEAANLSFGNADKYLRDSLWDAYFTDDWRITSWFTLNAGVRWEYGAPITELYGRLVNLDVLPGFVNTDSNTFPVLASSGVGAATGQHYPASLIHPDRHAFEPRVAIGWRPLPASSLVIRAGYGVYYDTSVYEVLAQEMATQFPLAKSLSLQNT
ncbi:MAG TPA: carboxypeptidase regulatory-like domain-containing protein, partial [Bryobacteraceae bacterium]|nr:carboxypeptidase regulatory-like domain-containing protein [Bryobacteraceae bacterium]